MWLRFLATTANLCYIVIRFNFSPIPFRILFTRCSNSSISRKKYDGEKLYGHIFSWKKKPRLEWSGMERWNLLIFRSSRAKTEWDEWSEKRNVKVAKSRESSPFSVANKFLDRKSSLAISRDHFVISMSQTLNTIPLSVRNVQDTNLSMQWKVSIIIHVLVSSRSEMKVIGSEMTAKVD